VRRSGWKGKGGLIAPFLLSSAFITSWVTGLQATTDIEDINRAMDEYNFATVWTLDAPIEVVWDALVASERWPEWWPYLDRVVELAGGDSDGIGAIRHFTWHGSLPYTLAFDIMVTKIERPVHLEGVTSGDLEGVGRWTLAKKGECSTRVQYDWNVRTIRPWMKMIAPLARWFFVWNHNRVMMAGGEGLAGYLRSRG
jgi:Polyketide cyclase / dehydrase and lipid transport